jgi:hypothetical protein
MRSSLGPLVSSTNKTEQTNKQTNKTKQNKTATYLKIKRKVVKFLSFFKTSFDPSFLDDISLVLFINFSVSFQRYFNAISTLLQRHFDVTSTLLEMTSDAYWYVSTGMELSDIIF